MDVQDKPPEQNGGRNIYPPSYRLVRRVTTFDLDRKITGEAGVDLTMGEMTLEEIVSQTIERTMEKVQGELLRKPNARIEDLLSLGPLETKQLWETNLQSIKEFRGKQILHGKPIFADTNMGLGI